MTRYFTSIEISGRTFHGKNRQQTLPLMRPIILEQKALLTGNLILKYWNAAGKVETGGFWHKPENFYRYLAA